MQSVLFVLQSHKQILWGKIRKYLSIWIVDRAGILCGYPCLTRQHAASVPFYALFSAVYWLKKQTVFGQSDRSVFLRFFSVLVVEIPKRFLPPNRNHNRPTFPTLFSDFDLIVDHHHVTWFWYGTLFWSSLEALSLRQSALSLSRSYVRLHVERHRVPIPFLFCALPFFDNSTQQQQGKQAKQASKRASRLACLASRHS